MVESTAKLQEEIKALSGVDIMKDKNTFKSTYEIMDELSQKWEGLTDIQQASITELIAGKRQGNLVSSLMENFDIARETLQTSLNSEGSAMKEHEKWLDSAQAKILQLEASWEGLSMDFLSSDTVKFGVDALRELVNVVDSVVNALTPLGTVIAGFAGKYGIQALAKSISANGGLLKALTLIPPQAAAVAVGIAAIGTAVVAVKKHIDDTKIGANLSKDVEEIKEHTDNIIELNNLSKELEEIELVINTPTSTTEQVDAAKQRLQEIVDLVNQKYELNISSNTEDLGDALTMLSYQQRGEMVESVEGLIGGLKGTNYKEAKKTYESDLKKKNELQKLNNDFTNLMSQWNVASNISDVNKRVSEQTKVSDKFETFYKQLKDMGYNDFTNGAGKQQWGADYLVFADTVRETIDKVNESDTVFKNFEENSKKASEYLSQVLSSDIKNGDKYGVDTDVALFEQLGNTLKEAGMSTNGLAKDFAVAKQGLNSFQEAIDKGATGAVANDYIAFKKSLGETAESAVQNAALLKNGFTDVNEAISKGEDAVNAVLKDMLALGNEQGLFEGMDMSQTISQLTEMAKALGLIHDKSKITIDTDGNYQVVHEAKEALDALNKHKDLEFQVEANGDITLLESANEKLNWLISKGDVTFEANASGDALDVLDKTGKKIAEIDGETGEITIVTKIEGDDTNEVFNNAQAKLKELGKIDVDFNINADSNNIDAEINKAKTLLDSFRREDGTVDLSVDGAAEAQTLLALLIEEKQRLDGKISLDIDTSGLTSAQASLVSSLQSLNEAMNTFEVNTSIGVDSTEAENEIRTIVNELAALPEEEKVALGINDEGVQAAIANIQNTPINATLNISDVSAVQTAIQNIGQQQIDGVVTWKDDETNLAESFTRPGVVEWTSNEEKLPQSFSRTGWVTWKSANTPKAGGAPARGTAFAQGTAFKLGSWGTKSSGVALGGELGEEIVVRDGHFFTIGTNSAELFNYKKGDIIFNAEQSKQIFEKGRITTGNRRGKAFAAGTSQKEIKSLNDLFEGVQPVKSREQQIQDLINDKNNGLSESQRYFLANPQYSSDTENEPEYFDWIDRFFKKFERGLNSISEKVDDTFSLFSDRNTNLQEQIALIGQEKEWKQAAYERYMTQVNAIGLGEEYITKIQNGNIDISMISDETLSQKINDYIQWYDAAMDCKEAIDELSQTEKDLKITQLDNLVGEFDGILGRLTARGDLLQAYLDKAEQRGYLGNTAYYQAMVETEEGNIAYLKMEQANLQTELNKLVDSGEIAIYSEEWDKWQQKINDCSIAIVESEDNVISFKNEIRQINWDTFDKLQEKISSVAEEADFLIELMGSSQLFDDNGKLTDEGMATMGLHSMNYNTYMEQAKKYREEIDAIALDMIENPHKQYDFSLIERREELNELQREAILNANNEKEAIKELVSDGIETELTALQELIDTYTEALDTEKELYDYQKNVTEKSKEIASLQKQLAAYENDSSEETKAKIQQLKVSLREAEQDLQDTQYDKYISDQKELLSSLYENYENTLNSRLDNIDDLIDNTINSVNANSDDIESTIKNVSDSVGYELSSTMKDVWSDEDKNNLSVYQNGVTSNVSALKLAVENISTTLNEIRNYQENNAQGGADYATSNPFYAIGTEKEKPTVKVDNSTTPIYDRVVSLIQNLNTNTAKLGNSTDDFFISLKSSYPKSQLSIDTSIVDRLAYFDFDNSFSARSSYYAGMGYTDTYKSTGEQNIKMLNWMKANGYKNGAYALKSNEIAWTQESGLEAIIRPSDGAILTPLAKNDSVLNATATSDLFDFANNPSAFIQDKINGEYPVNSLPVQSHTDYHGDINFKVNLPNVTNYEQFKNAMLHDKQFENLIKSSTIDKLAYRDMLKKYRH